MTQCERILQYLDEFGSISQLEATRDLGILRLAARISDIRKEHGFSYIDSVTETSENRYGDKTSYSVYFKEGDKRWVKRQETKGNVVNERLQIFSKNTDTMVAEGSSSVG